jgi:hypothetical protein
MSQKTIIILILMFFSILYLNKLFWKKEYNYYNIIMILLFICLGLNFKVADNIQSLFDEGNIIYVPVVVFIIAMAAIIRIRFDSLKFKLDEFILISILISILLSYINGQINDVFKFYSIVVLYLSIFFIGFMYKNLNEYDVERILNAFSYMAIFNGILGTLQYITNKKLLIGAFNDNIFYAQDAGSVKRTVGLAFTNNAAGNLGAILFCIVLFNYLRTKRKIHLSAVIINGIFLALTLTRLGYLAAIAEAAIFFLLSKWNSISKIIKKMGLVSGGIFCVLIVALIYGDKIYNTLFIQRGNTEMSRAIQYQNVFENIIYKNTFWNGIGVGQYKYYSYYNLGITDIDIHSQYISVLAEQGIFIFILFIILNLYILKKALDNAEYKLEKAFVISLFIGNLICCNFNPNEYYLINNLLYYLLMYCYVHKKRKIKVIQK